MAQGHKDYSATPLWKKLGIRQGSRVVVTGAPVGFDDVLEAQAPLPPEVDFLTRATKGIDVAVVFVTEHRVLVGRFAAMKRALEPNGRLWVAWPKQASKVATDLSFGVVAPRARRRTRRQQDGVDHRRVPGVPVRGAPQGSPQGPVAEIGRTPARPEAGSLAAAGTLGRCPPFCDAWTGLRPQ